MKYLFWLVLVIGIGGVYYQYASFKAADKQAVLELTESEIRRKILENTILRMVRLEGTSINTSVILTSTEGNSLLKDLLTDPVLIFKFNANDCTDCSHQQFSFLKELKDKFPSLRIIVLYEVANLNAYKIERKLFFSPDKFYGVTKFQIPEQCYFILDKDGQVTNFFLPTLENTELTKQYLEIIATRYFKE
jgi:hypothetical protein